MPSEKRLALSGLDSQGSRVFLPEFGRVIAMKG